MKTIAFLLWCFAVVMFGFGMGYAIGPLIGGS